MTDFIKCLIHFSYIYYSKKEGEVYKYYNSIDNVEITFTPEQLVEGRRAYDLKQRVELVSSKRNDRAIVIDTLISGAQGTESEQYIKLLFKHYYTDVLHFKEEASSDFREAIASETDPTIKAILDSELIPGLKVRDAISVRLLEHEL